MSCSLAVPVLKVVLLLEVFQRLVILKVLYQLVVHLEPLSVLLQSIIQLFEGLVREL